MHASVTVSAPGSTMITGEHAVVYGAPAIVAAIEQRVTVELRKIDRAELRMSSQIAPPASMPLDDLRVEGPYRFVIACVRLCLGRVTSGLQINIQSEIDHTLGLGSSAAITIATLAALEGTTSDSLHAKALTIVRDIQGRGSGADLAASLRGGVLAYTVEGDDAAVLDPLPPPPQLSLCNVGYKTPTSEVLAHVAAARQAAPQRIDRVFEEMRALAHETIDEIKGNGWLAATGHLTRYQSLMKRLGVSDQALDEAVARATATDGVLGAKISGSGLGDCAMAIGAVPDGYVPVVIAKEGVVFHDHA